MESFSTCLIEKNALLREGMKSLFAGTNFKVVRTYSNIDSPEMANEEKDKISLVIIGIDDDTDDPAQSINSIREYYPDSRIAVLSSDTDIDFIALCFSAGADGYFARDISPNSLLNSLNMVMAGEKICPAFVLAMILKNNVAMDGKQPDYDLSRREMEVLKHLASGQTNKQIAIIQNITEATVKVHVKSILRKLSLSNRTQAAIWALNEGLFKHAPDRRTAA